MTAGKSNRLWAEAMNYACEMSYRCTTASLSPGVSPYKLWVDTGPRLITSSRLEPLDTCGDPNPNTSWRHAGPSASCSASTLTTRGEPSASANSPPAKSPCFRPSYGTPQPTPERQFPETRQLRGGRRDTGITRRDSRKPPTTRLHWGAWRLSPRSRNRNSMSREGRVDRKVHVHLSDWSMRRGELLGRRGKLRRSLNQKKRVCQSPKRMSRAKTRSTTRVSSN